MQLTSTELKNKLKEDGTSGLALDIDNTLSQTVGWWLKEMIKLFGNPEGLTPEELMKKYRYIQHIPYWQSEEVTKWVKRMIESDKVQEDLPLIENSDKVVQEINKVIPIVAYITVRPESVLRGTSAWLVKHDFPNAAVIARPESVKHKDGNKWKADLLHKLYPQVLGIIDDNPELVDVMHADYKGSIYLYDNLEHHRKDLKVIPCSTWEDVRKAF